MVQAWLYAKVKRAIRPDGTMLPADLALYTRALVASPLARIAPAPRAETFEWVQQPSDGSADGKVYVDGSRIDGDSQYADLCARHGWAFAAYDEQGTLLAAAKGRPPSWAEGIHGAELWGLFMAVTCADPWSPIRVDCSSLQQGSQKGLTWASAPDRCLARIWSPLNAALDDDPSRVVWMPAHCSQAAVGVKQLGNGEKLSAIDVAGNALVDRLAKEAARADRLSRAQLSTVRGITEKLTAVATWIGQATVLANHFPGPRGSATVKSVWLRDAQGSSLGRCVKQMQLGRKRTQVHSQPSASSAGLAEEARWEALRRRIQRKEQDNQVSAQGASSSSLAKVIHEAAGTEEARSGGPVRRREPTQKHSGPREQMSLHARAVVVNGPLQVQSERASSQTCQERESKGVRLDKKKTTSEDGLSDMEAVRRDLEELQASGLQVRWPRYQPLCRSAGGGSKGRGPLLAARSLGDQ